MRVIFLNTAGSSPRLLCRSLGMIALYQLGLLRCLPEPPLSGLDPEKMNRSAEAYYTPDAVLGSGGVAAIVAARSCGYLGTSDG